MRFLFQPTNLIVQSKRKEAGEGDGGSRQSQLAWEREHNHLYISYCHCAAQTNQLRIRAHMFYFIPWPTFPSHRALIHQPED